MIHFACHSIEPNLFKRFVNRCVLDGFLKIYQEICEYILNSFWSQLQTNLSQVWHVFATSLMPHFGVELHQISMPPDAGCPDHTASDWSKVFCTSREQFQGGGTCFNVSWFWMYISLYSICTTKIVLHYINFPMLVCLVLDQEGLIVVTKNSAFICRVNATNYDMSPWLSLQWPRRSCQDVCDDIEDNGNDMGWHWSDWIFAIFWRLRPSCPGCSCHGGEINTTIWITSAFMRRVAVTLITYRCLHKA